MIINDQYDPDKFFEEAFKGAKKEYLERSQKCKSPLDMQNVSIFSMGLAITSCKQVHVHVLLTPPPPKKKKKKKNK